MWLTYGLRLLQLWPRAGPLVLMLRNMLRDVLLWSLLLVVVLVAFGAAIFTLLKADVDAARASPECESDTLATQNASPAISLLLYLFGVALNGEADLGCFLKRLPHFDATAPVTAPPPRACLPRAPNTARVAAERAPGSPHPLPNRSLLSGDDGRVPGGGRRAADEHADRDDGEDL